VTDTPYAWVINLGVGKFNIHCVNTGSSLIKYISAIPLFISILSANVSTENRVWFLVQDTSDSIMDSGQLEIEQRTRRLHVSFAANVQYLFAIEQIKSFFLDNGFQIRPVHEWLDLETGEQRRRYPSGWTWTPTLYFRLDYQVGKSFTVGGSVQQLGSGEVTAYTRFDTVLVDTLGEEVTKKWRVYVKEKQKIKSYYFHLGYRKSFKHSSLQRLDYYAGVGISLNSLNVQLHSITAFNDTLAFRRMRFGGNIYAGLSYYLYPYVSVGLFFRTNIVPSEAIRSFSWTDARSYSLPAHKVKFSGFYMGIVLGYHL